MQRTPLMISYADADADAVVSVLSVSVLVCCQAGLTVKVPTFAPSHRISKAPAMAGLKS